jgi:hypothetical protein
MRAAQALRERLGALPSGSLSFFGDVFGDRADHLHTIISVDASPQIFWGPVGRK